METCDVQRRRFERTEFIPIAVFVVVRVVYPRGSLDAGVGAMPQKQLYALFVSINTRLEQRSGGGRYTVRRGAMFQ